MKKITTILSLVFIFALYASVASAQVQGRIMSDISSCTIAVGEGTCGVKISWSTSNTEPLPSFPYVSGPGIKADGNYGDRNVEIVHGSSKYELIYRHQVAGSTNYYLTNLGYVNVNATCAIGSSWNRTICISDETTIINPNTNCGPGTHAVNGTCVIDTVVTNCGPGTYLSGGVCKLEQKYNNYDDYDDYYDRYDRNYNRQTYNNYVPPVYNNQQPYYNTQPVFYTQPPVYNQPIINTVAPQPTVVTRTVYRNVNTTTTPKKETNTNTFVNGIGTHSPIVLSIEEKYGSVARGDTVDFTVKYKNIGNTKLTRPLLQVIVPNNITLTNSSSGGTYQQEDHTLSVLLPDLNPNDEGTVYVQGLVSKPILGNAKLVTKALLVYTTPNNTQESVMAYTAQGGKVDSNNNLGANALFGGGSFGLASLLVILILVLIIILIFRAITNRSSYNKNSNMNSGH